MTIISPTGNLNWTSVRCNKAKGRISKWVLQENKAWQILRKTNISYALIRTWTCAYQEVRNVRFSENPRIYGIVSFFIPAGIMSPNILLWCCCNVSSVASNNWVLIITSPSWFTSYWWLNLCCWSSSDCCSKMSLAFSPLVSAYDASNWKYVVFHVFSTTMIYSSTLDYLNVTATRLSTHESVKYQLIAPFLQHNVYIYW